MQNAECRIAADDGSAELEDAFVADGGNTEDALGLLALVGGCHGGGDFEGFDALAFGVFAEDQVVDFLGLAEGDALGEEAVGRLWPPAFSRGGQRRGQSSRANRTGRGQRAKAQRSTRSPARRKNS